LAVRCPQQAALEERDNFPIASEIILRDFYMDDLLTGASSVQKAAKLKQEINYILNEAGFEIFQRASNSVELMPSLKKKKTPKSLQVGKISANKFDAERNSNISSTTHNQIFDLKNRVFELETEVKSLTLSNDRTFAAKVTALFTDFLTPNQVRVVLKKETKTRQDEIRMK
jgi:hypothetical protein